MLRVEGSEKQEGRSPDGEGFDPQEGASRSICDVGGVDIGHMETLDHSSNQVSADTALLLHVEAIGCEQGSQMSAGRGCADMLSMRVKLNRHSACTAVSRCTIQITALKSVARARGCAHPSRRAMMICEFLSIGDPALTTA